MCKTSIIRGFKVVVCWHALPPVPVSVAVPMAMSWRVRPGLDRQFFCFGKHKGNIETAMISTCANPTWLSEITWLSAVHMAYDLQNKWWSIVPKKQANQTKPNQTKPKQTKTKRNKTKQKTKQKAKQANKQRNEQTNKQTNKQANKQTSKQANKQTSSY